MSSQPGSWRKIMTFDAVEFIRRFLLHVLPFGLVRIRQFGFLANRFHTPNLQLCRDLLARSPSSCASRFPQHCRYQCSRSLALSGLEIRAVDRIPSHDSNCAVSGILSLVFVLKNAIQYPVDS